MKKLLLILLLFMVSLVSAQQEFMLDTSLTTSLCQTPQTTTHLNQLDQLRSLTNDPVIRAKIYIHVLRRETTPYGGQTIEGVNRTVKNIYDVFDAIDLYFSWDGDINYIYDNDFYTPNQVESQTIINTYNHSDGIDIYLVDDSQFSVTYTHNVGEATGIVYGGYLPETFTSGYLGFTSLARSNYIAHLIGHVLMLFHTHYGSDSNDNTCAEFADGTNGHTCGDFINDTPADPNLFTQGQGINVDHNCNFTPLYYNPNPPLDPNGQEYNPDTTNFMSNTRVSCMDHFTYDQIKIMKGAIWFIAQIQPIQLTDYTYIRAEEDCYVCETSTFTVFTTEDISGLEILSTNNIETNIIPISSNSFLVEATNLIGGGEGEQGYFYVVESGNTIGDPYLATQPLWVGLPQTMPDGLLAGDGDDDIAISPATGVGHNIGGYYDRYGGIDTFGWEYPEPNIEVTNLPNDPTTWNYRSFNKYFNFASSNTGSVTGWVRVKGVNSCGLGSYGLNNEICVKSTGDGAPDCDAPEPLPIVYYPNPTSSLLQVDLSLQADYKTFTVVIYDEQQTVRYSETSNNIIKTIDVMDLPNGTYYLHVYDGSEVVLSNILIINH